MAPEPERVIESVPEAKALDAIAVGVAVKLAKVPPTAATAITEIAARVRRIFDSGRFLSICVSVPFGFGGHAHLRLPPNGDGPYVGMNSVGVESGRKLRFRPELGTPLRGERPQAKPVGSNWGDGWRLRSTVWARALKRPRPHQYAYG